MKWIAKIFQTLIFGNIFVAVCAYFLSTQELYFDGKIAFVNPPSLFIFFSTLLIYNYRKLFFSGEELFPALTQRSKWVVSNRKALAIITLCSVYGILISSFSMQGRTFLFLLPLFLISVFYGTPLSRKRDSKKRLRYLPFLKIFLVAGVWTVVSVLLPVVENDFENLYSNSLVFTLVTRFLFLFAITLPFDVRDMKIDAQNNIKTIPVVLGEKKTIQLAVICLVLFIGMYAFRLISASNEPYYKNIGYVISGLISLPFVAQSVKNKNEYYTSFWIEGLMVIQFLLIYLIKILAGNL